MSIISTFFQDLKKAMEEGQVVLYKFQNLKQAMAGLRQRYKKHANFHYMEVTDENSGADIEAVTPYTSKLQEIIDEEGFSPKQIFHANRAGLLFLEESAFTFISHDEKQTPVFNILMKLAFLLGVNLKGEAETFLVYHSQNCGAPNYLSFYTRTKRLRLPQKFSYITSQNTYN